MLLPRLVGITVARHVDPQFLSPCVLRDLCASVVNPSWVAATPPCATLPARHRTGCGRNCRGASRSARDRVRLQMRAVREPPLRAKFERMLISPTITHICAVRQPGVPSMIDSLEVKVLYPT
jgi:hypothetical protein